MNVPSESKVRQLFELVMTKLPAERNAFLERICGSEFEMFQRVAALVEAQENIGDFLSEPTGGVPDLTPPELEADEKTGSTLGAFTLVRPIGEGGMGTVWLAEQFEPVKRKVALKVIKLGMDTEEVIKRFDAERQALALMDHPNIAKVLEAGSTPEGRPYFVMELVRGVPIDEFCAANELSTRERIELFIRVCQAIQHAHQKGIIHRDIKPNNVLVSRHDGEAVPKVIDFGIAKATGAELAQRTMLTEAQQIVGTPEYMSPEQVEMTGVDIDTRSDIYSLGVLLYELLTGTRPFDAKELFEKGLLEMIRVIKEEEPPRPSTRVNSLGDTARTTAAQQQVSDTRSLSSRLRGDLDWIVMKCLAKERDRRYETASGLAADLRRHLDDEPVMAGPPSAKYRLQKFVRRNRAQVVAGSVVLAALVLGIAGTTWGMFRAQDAESDTARELVRANEIKRFMGGMLTSVSPREIQLMDTELMRRILDDSAKRIDEGGIEDEMIAAELDAIIGGAYYDIGRFRDADRHQRRAWETRARRLEDDHPQTLASAHRLAEVAVDLGEMGEARSLAEATLESRKRVLGANHEDTIQSMVQLGRIYFYLNIERRVPEFPALAQATYDTAVENLGPDHAHALRALRILIMMHGGSGNLREQERLTPKLHAGYLRVLGPTHPDTITAIGMLAKQRGRHGRTEECIQMYQESIDALDKLYGKGSRLAASTAGDLANRLIYLGRYAEAERILAARFDSKTLTETESTSRILGFERLARAYMRQGKFIEALAIAEPLLVANNKATGGHGHHAMDIAILLTLCYEATGEFEKARPFRKHWQAELVPGRGGEKAGHGHGGGHSAPQEQGATQEHGAKPEAHGKPEANGKPEAHGKQDEHGEPAAHEEHDKQPGHGERAEEKEKETHKAPAPHRSPIAEFFTAMSLLAPNSPELHDPQLAKKFATRGVAGDEHAGGFQLWELLEALSLAQHYCGEHAEAAKTAERALLLVSAKADEIIRIRYRKQIAQFKAAAGN
jgi:serine/threonine protein kinase